jgi:hypothetical protein
MSKSITTGDGIKEEIPGLRSSNIGETTKFRIRSNHPFSREKSGAEFGKDHLSSSRGWFYIII